MVRYSYNAREAFAGRDFIGRNLACPVLFKGSSKAGAYRACRTGYRQAVRLSYRTIGGIHASLAAAAAPETVAAEMGNSVAAGCNQQAGVVTGASYPLTMILAWRLELLI